MCANILNTVRNLPFQRLPGALFHILVRQKCFTFSPTFNAFKQSARLVPVRLARGLRSIKVNMRLNKWRDRQTASPVKNLLALRLDIIHKFYGVDAPIFDGYLPQPFTPDQTHILN
ncbi:hypothetical protein D3C75_960130 [compost metagenome]